MSQEAKKLVPKWSFSKTIVLPFTQITVEISMPSWAQRTQARESAKALGKFEDDDTIVGRLMLVGCATFNGEPIDPDTIDELPFQDTAYLMAEFFNWTKDTEKKA